MSTLSSGTVLGGQWRVQAFLGEGACAKVYSVQALDALNRNLPYEVVAKVIPLGGGTKGKGDKAQERLANTLYYEYSLYTGVLYGFPCCPQLPLKFYGEDATLRLRYLAMEKMDMDLIAYSKRGPVAVSEVAKLGLQILTGLRWLHNKHFLFVDVKPDNYMLKGDKLYFIDFGLVSRMASAQSVQQAPGERCFEGTPSYSSVGADQGEPACGRDDIEAMGYVLLSLFNEGSLPWTDSKSDVELHQKKAACDIMALARSYHAEEVGRIIEECRALKVTEKVPYNRFEEYLNQMQAKVSTSSSSSSSKPSSAPAKKAASAPPKPTASQVVQEAAPVITKTHVTKAVVKESVKPAAKAVVKEVVPIVEKATAEVERKPATKVVKPARKLSSNAEEEEAQPVHKKPKTTSVLPQEPRTARLKHVIDLVDHDEVSDNLGAMDLNEGPFSSPSKQRYSLRSTDGPFSPTPAKSDKLSLHVATLKVRAHGHHKDALHDLKLSPSDSEQVVVIGREQEESDIALSSDEAVSSRHLKVKIARNGSMFVMDEKSTNGTVLNGIKIPAKRWKEVVVGCRLQIGGSILEFCK